MAVLKVYDGSSWVPAVGKTYDGAAWADQMKFYDGAAFIDLYASGPTVIVAPVKLIANYRFEIICYAGVRVHLDGNLYQSSPTNSYTNDYEIWLDDGSNSEVWVERTIISGTLTSDAGTGRLACSTSRTWYISRGFVGTKNTSIDLKFYDAASGGNLLDTQRVNLSAEYDADGGPCPLCCFTPDTEITMAPTETKPIGDIKVGDMILVKRDGKLVAEAVTEIITRRNRTMFRIHFADGGHINSSDDHPFHVEGKGPASINHHNTEYKNLGLPAQLEIGDQVQDEDGKLRSITRFESISYPGTVYTFGNSLFFANGTLVY